MGQRWGSRLGTGRGCPGASGWGSDYAERDWSGVAEVLQPQTWEGWGSFLLVPTLPQTQVVENVSCSPETKGAGAGFWHMLVTLWCLLSGRDSWRPQLRRDPWAHRQDHTRSQAGAEAALVPQTDTRETANRHFHKLVPQRRGQSELSLGRGGHPTRASREGVVSAEDLPGGETVRLRERRVELGLSMGRPGWWRQDASQVRFLRGGVGVEGRLGLRA